MTAVASGGGTRPVMMTTAVSMVGNKEKKTRGRNTAGLNQNHNRNQDMDQY